MVHHLQLVLDRIDPLKAEVTCGVALKLQHEGAYKQLEVHQQAIHGITERLDGLNDMLRTLVESRQCDFAEGGISEPRGVYEERNILPRGVWLDFPHFEGNNPTGWIFEATQYFEFH